MDERYCSQHVDCAAHAAGFSDSCSHRLHRDDAHNVFVFAPRIARSKVHTICLVFEQVVDPVAWPLDPVFNDAHLHAL
jgi:hypothetical protein